MTWKLKTRSLHSERRRRRRGNEREGKRMEEKEKIRSQGKEGGTVDWGDEGRREENEGINKGRKEEWEK